MKTFEEYMKLREADVDTEIANNPNLLKEPGQSPEQQKLLQNALMKKKQNPNASFGAALKATMMTQQMNQMNQQPPK